MNKLIKEELNTMKYLLGYQRGKLISEQSAPASQTPSTVEEAIKQLQTLLNTKYGAKLNVDGKWGNLSQAALDAAVKSKGTGTPKATGEVTPPVAPVTPKTVIPGTPDAPNPTVSGTTGQSVPAQPAAAPAAPAAGTTPAAGTLNQASQQALSGQLTPQQIRQQSRFDQRLARQARRTQNRAQQ